MTEKYLDAVCRERQSVNPLFNFLRVRIGIESEGRARLTLPVGPGLIQGGGAVAGGILATMADEVMAHAVMSAIDARQSIVTVEMNMRYLRSAGPCREADLYAVGRLLKRGKNLCTAESEVFDEKDRLLAAAGATFYVLNRP
ncbi:MAG: PaaI family thioesterase [Desulfovibrio sp.]|jgi:uncharacterized protein (TIGR00369 family)|nr:PaaI family thioesterase [Desulfovibrio sp.]